jgi:putative membrane protein
MIFLILTIIWIYIVTRPLERSYNIDGLKIMQQAFAHFTEGESSGLELENFFESFGKTVTASVSILAVKKLDVQKSDKKAKYKALIVVPDVHKGPFGYLGGSNMPEKLARELGPSTDHLLVPHGTATHDMNPVSTAETNRLSRAAKKALDELKPSQFSSSGSKFMRAKGPSNVNITMHFIGETPVSTYTSAPEPTDDINRQIGPEARAIMLSTSKNSGRIEGNPAPVPLFIDAHNSMVPGKGYVHYNSQKSRTIIKTLKDAVIENVKTKTKNGLKIGGADIQGFDVENDGLGPMGIQVLVVNTPPDNKVAYILFDGNNLELGLRKKIIAHVKAQKLVDNVEVLTTDNHIVNMTIGGYSPVGQKIDRSKLFKTLDKLVKEAHADLEPVEVASTGYSLDNFKVFGPGNTLKLSTTINNTMSLIGKSFVICYGTAFGLAVAVMAILIA